MEINISMMAKTAGINLEEIGAEIEAEFQAGLRKLVIAADHEAKKLAAERLKDTAKEYQRALRLETKENNTYLI